MAGRIIFIFVNGEKDISAVSSKRDRHTPDVRRTLIRPLAAESARLTEFRRGSSIAEESCTVSHPHVQAGLERPKEVTSGPAGKWSRPSARFPGGISFFQCAYPLRTMPYSFFLEPVHARLPGLFLPGKLMEKMKVFGWNMNSSTIVISSRIPLSYPPNSRLKPGSFSPTIQFTPSCVHSLCPVIIGEKPILWKKPEGL